MWSVVATVPTVYGIETHSNPRRYGGYRVATVPTVYGIETQYGLGHFLYFSI